MTADEQKIRDTYVTPFYMTSRDESLALAPEITRLGREAPLETILFLLDHRGWREMKVGAFFALVRREPEVTASLLAALSRSGGSLNITELCVAAYLTAGQAAVESLRAFQLRAKEGIRPEVEGSAIAAVALELLGQHSDTDATPAARESFATMMQIAAAIRGAGV